MERKQEEADRLRRSELMKKNAEQNRKLEQEKREREKQSKLKGLEQDKKIEMDALANSGQATKKYIYEVMHETTCPKEINPSGIEWPIGATRIVAGSLYNFKNCHIESCCLNRKGINDSEFLALATSMIKNKSVRKLELEGNSIENAKSIDKLTEMIKTNETLQHLSLECNTRLYTGTTKENFKVLLDALKENESLLSINFSFCGLLNDVLPRIKDML